MVYALLVCTYVAATPHVVNCHMPGNISDPSLVLFQVKAECTRAAAQRNLAWHDKPGAAVWTRYVCLDRPPPADLGQ